MSEPVTIVWFRRDLRLTDNPALGAAAERGGAVIPLFMWCPEDGGDWAPGGAQRWWLHHSLAALSASLEDKGSRLVLRQGPAKETLEELLEATGADAVYWNRRYEPALIDRDRELKSWLQEEAEVEAKSFNSHLLFEPWEVETKGGGPYKVYSPFWRMTQSMPEPDGPGDEPEELASPKSWPDSVGLDSLGLEPTRDWKDGLAAQWTPGEAGARERLDRFLSEGLEEYKDERDFPGREGVSRLSPHLHHGEIGPRLIYREVRRYMKDGRRDLGKAELKQCEHFVKEIFWREFAYHVLYHFPETPTEPLQAKYADFPWDNNKEALKQWQKGQTGYPIVDAGMRQLYATGWMHNRVRMIVASFLVKDLLISWEEGAAWFWDTLVDADLASNTLGWQWAGGCGADAAPYFRIFNPVLQGEKFDGDGDYVRRWVPELAELPNKVLHKPWEAEASTLEEAGVVLGEDYPERIVDHQKARESALAALDAVKG
ncbi:MAG: deoxyribodipyrimidine photo-lyase [Planctomycetota bacterium]